MIFAYLTGIATGVAACVLYRILRNALTERFERCVPGEVPRLVMSSSVGQTTYAMVRGRWFDAETGKSVGDYETLGRNPELTSLYIAHKDEVTP